MSTTRWIIETPCEHGYTSKHYNTYMGGAHGGDTSKCPGGTRIVVDPDNLPTEAIERVARALHQRSIDGRHYEWDKWFDQESWRNMAFDAITAFLSDPEPGDQT